MEFTIISAQGLKNKSLGPFSQRLRPFITITTYPPPPHSSNGGKGCHVYVTRVDDGGGENPTWGDKFHIPIDASFFASRHSCVHLQLYSKRPVAGRVQLGWCQIPVSDIGYPPQGSVRYMCYRMRARDGTRGHGIVNLAIKLTGCLRAVVPRQRLPSDPDDDQRLLATGQTVIGIPVTVFSQRSVCW